MVAILSMTSLSGKPLGTSDYNLQMSKNQFTFPYFYHHTFVERCVRNHFMKFRGELTPQSQKWQFSTSQLSQLVAILSMTSWSGKPLGTDDYDLKMSKIGSYTYTKPPCLHRDVSWESLYEIWRDTDLPRAKNCNFPSTVIAWWS